MFRDALRADPELAAEYTSLKHRPATEVDHVPLAYLNGKTDFTLGTVERHGGVRGGDCPVRDLGRGARPE